MNELVARRVQVLRSAEGVFFRLGYGRAGMRELAEAAGMSRPALYNLYPRKHLIFAAVIAAASEDARVEDRSERSLQSLRSWLSWACELWLGHEAAGLPDDSGAKYPQRLERFFEESDLFNTMLREALARIAPWLVDAPNSEEFFRLLAFCLWGLVVTAPSETDRKRLLDLQIGALVDSAALSSASDVAAVSAKH
ncbi:TetR/AcrR family transcriptional regulator [soil metagenome]